MLINKSKFSIHSWLSGISVALLGFGMPWSSALFRISVFFIILIGLWGLYREIKTSKFKSTKENPYKTPSSVVIYSSMLSLWVLFSYFWSNADLTYYGQDAWRYMKLLMIPVIAFVIKKSHFKDGRIFVLAYALGVLVLMLPTMLDGFGIVLNTNTILYDLRDRSYYDAKNQGSDLVYFRNHIVHGYHVAILFAIALESIFLSQKCKYIMIFICLMVLLDIFFFINGRMAFAGIVAVAAAFMLTRLIVLKELKSKVAILIALIILAFFVWSKFQDNESRIYSVYVEVSEYLNGKNINTSSGIRLQFLEISISLFVLNILTGAGAGAFSQELINSGSHLVNLGYSHSHNEYITILSQFGLIGFLFFALLIISLLKEIYAINDVLLRRILYYIVMIFLLNSLTDSSLYNLWEGWVLVYFAAVALSVKNSNVTSAPLK